VSVLSSFFPPPPISEHACFCFPVGSLVGLVGFWFPLSRDTWHEPRSKNGRMQPGEVNHPGNGSRGAMRGPETKQNTGDKTTGEPAIRKHEVANVDLLSPA
jgi:hypothetical protein